MTGYIDGTLKWALELKCAMRGGENWQSPLIAKDQLSDYQRFARVLENNQMAKYIFEDIFVLPDLFTPTINIDNEYLPDGGFRIRDRFAEFGGFQYVVDTCKRCPANVNSVEPTSNIAGCVGICLAQLYVKRMSKLIWILEIS